jgi:hypothetical protein
LVVVEARSKMVLRKLVVRAAVAITVLMVLLEQLGKVLLVATVVATLAAAVAVVRLQLVETAL